MKKFTAILLAVVMVFALGASAFAADTTPVTTKAVDTTLSVTVDYTIEGLYFDGTTLKSSATNGYYPFSFSFIVSDRSSWQHHCQQWRLVRMGIGQRRQRD